MLFDLPRPAVFAHRGARTQAPENTLAAFKLALAQGADAIELDTRITADGRVVVIHDQMLERTTNGIGRVAEKTAAELRELDAGSSFSEQYRGERIPLLQEVFDALGKKVFINVEFKDYGAAGNRLVVEVCGLVAKCRLEENVLFSSFFPPNLNRARELLPGVPRGLLALRHWAGAWARSFAFAFGDYAALHPSIVDVDSRAIQRVHRLKRRIHVWTVNEPEDVRRMKAWGADGIITDNAAMALQALGRSG
jgi:glycerophosphoryl diester phosphodiesterase